MNEKDSTLKKALDGFVAQQQSKADKPEPEKVLAFLEGEMSPEAEERFLEAAIFHQDILDQIRDRDGFLERETPAIPPEKLDTAWQSFQKKSAEMEGKQPHRTVDVRLWIGLAAVFFFAALGLGIVNESLRQDLRTIRSPTLASRVQDLYLDGRQTRSTEPDRASELEGIVQVFQIHLDPLWQDYPVYLFEIRTLSNEIVFQQEARPERDAFTLILRQDLFREDQTYRFVVSGRLGEETISLGSIPLKPK